MLGKLLPNARAQLRGRRNCIARLMRAERIFARQRSKYRPRRMNNLLKHHI